MKFAVAILATALSGCAIFPTPMDAAEKDRLAIEAVQRLFSGQEALDRPLSLAEAIARAIKYHADNRIRMMEDAAAQAQLDVAKFDLLPRLTTNAGYTTRNNDSFGFGFSPGGTIATNPSASAERSHTTLSVGFAWNILDFGVSYYRAKQLADQALIAEERRRKAVQTLMNDVRLAWWRAEAAQRLLPEIDELFLVVEQAVERTRIIEIRKLLPPLQTATMRRALLDLEQQISFRRQDLAQAKVELSALINVPPGSEVRVRSPEARTGRALELTADIGLLELAALRNRPELAEEGYKARITEAEARKAILGILPGLTFDIGANYDSNRFLVNNAWTSAGISMAFNLVKVFSLPALNRSAEAQKKVDEARRLAMAMAVMTQTRISAVRYNLIAHELGVWDDASKDDDLIVKYLESSAQVGIDTELELIRAKARAMISRINRDLANANLEAAVARLYNSVGYDATPKGSEQQGVADLTRSLEARFSELRSANFTASAERKAPALAIDSVTGVEEGVIALLRDGIDKVMKLSNVQLVQSPGGELGMTLMVDLQPEKGGGRTASVKVRLLERTTSAIRSSYEFKTTLSEPIENEQWQAVGEGVAYRAVGGLSGARMARASNEPAVAAAKEIPERTDFSDQSPILGSSGIDDEWRVALQIDPELRSLTRQSISQFDPVREISKH